MGTNLTGMIIGYCADTLHIAFYYCILLIAFYFLKTECKKSLQSVSHSVSSSTVLCLSWSYTCQRHCICAFLPSCLCTLPLSVCCRCVDRGHFVCKCDISIYRSQFLHKQIDLNTYAPKVTFREIRHLKPLAYNSHILYSCHRNLIHCE